MCDPIASTCIYEAWYEEYQQVQELIAIDKKEEEKLKLEKQLLLAKQKEESGIEPSSPTSEKSSKKKKTPHLKDHTEEPPSPSPADLRMPRDCKEVTEVLINCCGGRAELDRIIIPYTTPDGLYVLEVSDAVCPDCLCTSNSSVTSKLPNDMKDIYAVVTAIKNDSSYRFNIIGEGDK